MAITSTIRAVILAVSATGLALSAPFAAARGGKCHDGKADAIRLSGREISIIPQLTEALGNFEKEGVKVELVADTVFEGPHYRMQRALNRCEIDMSVHWFQHIFYGHAHNEPTVALMMFNGAPGLTIMVPNRVKDKVRSAADFHDLKVAEGMGYSTKSIIMNLLASRAGLPPRSYTPILSAPEGRLEATLKALDSGEVDVIAFREPQTSAIRATNRVSVIYDLTTPARTRKVLGAEYPAQTLFAAPDFLNEHPEQVQRVVNAFVRTMHFVNTHGADEIAAAMPAYFEGKDKEKEVALIRAQMPSYAAGKFGFKEDHAMLMQRAIDNAQYDDTVEGNFRALARQRQIPARRLFDNRFVDRAMKSVR